MELGSFMSTIIRILASRANGTHSNGPVSAEGKGRSSQNAITHGLLARHIVMSLAIETRLVENEAATQPAPDSPDRMSNAFNVLSAKPALGLIHPYQTRLYLNYQRTIQHMLLLRVLARPNEPRAGSPFEPRP